MVPVPTEGREKERMGIWNFLNNLIAIQTKEISVLHFPPLLSIQTKVGIRYPLHTNEFMVNAGWSIYAVMMPFCCV